ncbi:MAG: indole-3-glycerol-phosphate synthase [Armatimonadetes bacterium]|nr:indole-3-glycerol-phosphate synthase [Armatimonadota bacterium]
MRFSESLNRFRETTGRVPVITEIKCHTPKHGDLIRGRNPLDLLKIMEEAGSPAISVVTEPGYFHGSMDLLRQVASHTALPVLRKDFITTEAHVRETHEAGASCMLLIVKMNDDATLKRLNDLAHDLGMETLTEVHNEEEIRRAQKLDLDMIDINNRDIFALEKDFGNVGVTEKLRSLIPPEVMVVSASSFMTQEEVNRALDAGADAVLIGTSILQADDLKAKIEHFMDSRQGL